MLRINSNTRVAPDKRLYVDMDGVLVDFDSGVKRLSTRTIWLSGAEMGDVL